VVQRGEVFHPCGWLGGCCWSEFLFPPHICQMFCTLTRLDDIQVHFDVNDARFSPTGSMLAAAFDHASVACWNTRVRIASGDYSHA
jgi:hypothetical protein